MNKQEIQAADQMVEILCNVHTELKVAEYYATEANLPIEASRISDSRTRLYDLLIRVNRELEHQ